jgi:MFS family permease
MFSESYRRYVLALMTIVMTLNFVDRNLMVLLLQPIKDDLNLSDTQLGFLTGMAFAAFYAIVGIPIARLADRGDRVTITSIAIGLWSVTVMSCLLITNFAQLIAARVGASIGESGCMPPTYSLLGDYFPAAGERTKAVAIYWLGNPLSSLFSFIVGGYLNAHLGWRMTFFIMGIPGLLVAALFKRTIREPRMLVTSAAGAGLQLPRMTEVLATLWRQRSSRHLIAGMILLFTLGLGLAPWYGAFMIRSHGMHTTELGVWLGLIFGIGGTAGTWLGGYVASHWFANNERAQMRLCSIMIISTVPGYALFLLLPQRDCALIALFPSSVVFTFSLGPAFALLQRSVRNEMRATTLAVVMLLANLIGMGIGPQIVGILSDLLMPRLGNDSLRYAMLAMFSTAFWAAYHFWQIGKAAREDVRTVLDRV